MTHKNETYIITLVQPVIGIGKIWTISEISLKEKDTRNTKIYQNTTLGFQLTLPNESWYLPAVTDNDPHLYANQECANSERPNCAALEIQNHDSKFSQGPDATLNVLKADGQNPMKLSYLIQGATVIKSNAPGPAEGWGYKYDIFFQAANKRFLIFTNDAALEKSILPTFELTN